MVFDTLHPKVREACEKRFSSPTPVQENAIPVILSNKNTLVLAPTGIGKTESALLPLFSKFLKLREKDKRIGIINAYGRRAVIILHARGGGPEFATRILKRLRKNEDELFKGIVRAERDFARTSRYWR